MTYLRFFIVWSLLTLVGCSGNTKKEDPSSGNSGQQEIGQELAQSESNTTEEGNLVSNQSGPRKLALIVAIGNYANVGEYPFITAQSREWQDISSQNDVPLVKAALKAQGFSEQNITVLADKQATQAGIIQAIKTQLIEKAHAGDIVVFHFSGHGQQIADDNNDELDGYDEAIVPYDAAVKFVANVYEGANHIRDEMLGAMMTELRAKIGNTGQLLMVMDACHSGTLTRGLGNYRGTPEKMAPAGHAASGKSTTENKMLDEDAPTPVAETKNLAPFVLISASSADELNYETVDVNSNQKVGSLSLAFSKAMLNSGSSATYEGLFDNIRMDMVASASRQTPQLEGAKNIAVLGGTASKPANHFTVKEWVDKQNITLNGGELNGLMTGAELAFYDIDGDTTKPPKATGIVTDADFNECKVRLNSALEKENALRSWVYVTQMNFGDMNVAVKLDINDNPDFKKYLETELGKQALIKLVMESPELVVEMNNKYTATRGIGALQVVTRDEYTLYKGTVDETSYKAQAQLITAQALSYAQAKFLRSIEMHNADMKVTFEMVPVTVDKSGDMKVKDKLNIASKKNANGLVEFKIGDHFIFKVKNESTRDLYYCILDIQPDNVLTPLVPWRHRTAEEYKLKAGQNTVLPDIYTIYEPTGMETIKLIATEQPIDLKPIVATRGATEKANASPLAKLLADSYKTNAATTRGAATESVPPSSGFIHTEIFRIVK